ncbi:MAG: hypothetical protein AABW92_01520 [Nanoarchaeota archaeon]
MQGRTLFDSIKKYYAELNKVEKITFNITQTAFLSMVSLRIIYDLGDKVTRKYIAENLNIFIRDEFPHGIAATYGFMLAYHLSKSKSNLEKITYGFIGAAAMPVLIEGLQAIIMGGFESDSLHDLIVSYSVGVPMIAVALGIELIYHKLNKKE